MPHREATVSETPDSNTKNEASPGSDSVSELKVPHLSAPECKFSAPSCHQRIFKTAKNEPGDPFNPGVVNPESEPGLLTPDLRYSSPCSGAICDDR